MLGTKQESHSRLPWEQLLYSLSTLRPTLKDPFRGKVIHSYRGTSWCAPSMCLDPRWKTGRDGFICDHRRSNCVVSLRIVTNTWLGERSWVDLWRFIHGYRGSSWCTPSLCRDQRWGTGVLSPCVLINVGSNFHQPVVFRPF